VDNQLTEQTMINLQKPFSTETTMNRDLQAALEIARTMNDRQYHWVVTQIWDDGNLCAPTISTKCSMRRYEIKRIEEILDKYDCDYDLDFDVSPSARLQIVILENKR
jgi:hypothetical protein